MHRSHRLSNLSVNVLQKHVQQIITGARESERIAPRLAERGYDAEAFDALQAHLDAFADAASAYNRLDAEHQAAAQTFTEAAEAFRRGPFRDHVGLADAAFTGERGPQRLLGLDNGVGNVNTSYAEWHGLATTFYRELQSNDSLQDGIARVRLSEEEIQSGANEVARIESLQQRRNDLEAARQQARRERDAVRDDLETEVRRLQILAEVVLRETPDELERLGFVAPS
jgi:hypothetical protein